MTIPNFKEAIASDVSAFINPAEFADIHNVDGRQIRAVIESTDNEHPLAYAEGVSLLRIVAYFDSLELGYKPVEAMYMMIDGKRYMVKSVSDEAGIYAVTLEASFD
ncbi:hypothetical protein [Paenibacillus sp. NRS-1760]|uniref:hypothetical protein n=1 Tax=Paenibacillus sp. NRS-1760 TaxID=3233902 RepID=UPI003D2988DD